MRLLNLLVVVAALAAAAGGYLQDRARLARIRALPPAAARALYEAGQRRREKTMIAFAAALVIAAAVAMWRSLVTR